MLTEAYVGVCAAKGQLLRRSCLSGTFPLHLEQGGKIRHVRRNQILFGAIDEPTIFQLIASKICFLNRFI